MADNIQSFKAVCRGGLDATQNHLLLSDEKPGSATRLVNYETSLFGGYRRLEGYEDYGPNPIVGGDDAEGPVLGLEIFYNDSTLSTEIIAARKDRVYTYTVTGSTRSVFSFNDDNGRALTITNTANFSVSVDGSVLASSAYVRNGNAITLNTAAAVGAVVVIDNREYNFYRFVGGVGWSKYSTGVTRNTVTSNDSLTIKRIRSAKFNFGGGSKVCFVDGINNAVVYDGTNWKELSPTNSGGTSSPGGTNVPARPELVKAFEGYLFLGGDQTNASQIAYSDTRNETNFDPATNSSVIRVGFDLVQMAPFRTDLFIFGRNEIKKVVPDNDLVFLVEPVTANVGCVARDSVVEIGGDLAFLAPDGLRPVSGTSRIGDVEIETISKSIQTLVQTLPSLYDLSDLVSVVVRSKGQLRYFLSGATTTVTEGFGLIGGLRTSDQQLGWEFGELLGIRANCAASDYINGQEIVLHGDYDGKVYQQEKGTQFGGNDITAVYSTPFFDFGDTEVRKNLRRVNTFVRAEGNLEIFLGVTYDWFAADTANPQSFIEQITGRPVVYRGTNTTYNGSGLLYGGSDKPILSTAVEGSGFSARITYVTTGNFEPHSIQGIVLEYTQSGRR